MKKIKNIILHMNIIIFSLAYNHCSADPALASAGINTLQEFNRVTLPVFKKALDNIGNETIKANMPAFAAALTNAGNEALKANMPDLAAALTNAGNEALKANMTAFADALTNAGNEAFKANMPGFAAALTNVGNAALKENMAAFAVALAEASENFGKNFGVKALEMIGGAASAAGTAAYNAGVTTSTAAYNAGTAISAGAAQAAAAAKAGAIAAATAPATPYVIGGVVVSAGAYKVYRAYHPTPGEIARIAQCEEKVALSQLKIAQYEIQMEARKAQSRIDLMKIDEKNKAYRSAEEFNNCMTKHYKPKDAMQIPTACSNFARAFAETAGQKKVNEVVEIFNKYPVY
jgi:hypothetical protein